MTDREADVGETTAGEDRFHEGDQVQVLTRVPEGNPRTPHYLQGRTGTVVACHGVVVNPLDHQHPYPPLYSIVFPIADDRDPHDEVLADIHEEWLRASIGLR
jgi:nitrile hydratase subunit beta